MADVAVEALLNSIKDLKLYHSHLITDTKEEIERMEMHLRLFKKFLKDSAKKLRQDEFLRAVVNEIRDSVYEAQDILDVYVTFRTERKSMGILRRGMAFPSMAHLCSVAMKVEDIVGYITSVNQVNLNIQVDDQDTYAKSEYRRPRPKDVIGFEDVVGELIHRLTKETDYLDVVSLIGLPGLGKTMLASKIFNDPAILSNFPIRIWLSNTTCQDSTSARKISLAILKQFTTTTNDILCEKNDKELAQLAMSFLERAGNFLVVFDDVRGLGDWDRLRVALPGDGYKRGSKVMITSRLEEVGSYASNPRLPINLRFFTEKESWELLRLEALGKLDCPPELENAGNLIARHCGGLPLAIAVIGGTLASEFSASNISAMRNVWEKLCRFTSVNSTDVINLVERYTSLSFDRLPNHLRACFIYLGTFPEGYEIPVSSLIRMWIAEGFIQQHNDYSLEESGEMCLEHLININLVTAHKFKPNGKVRTCRIHDALRDFCRAEAENVNNVGFHEIKSSNGRFGSPVMNRLSEYRRVSVHSDFLEFISCRPFGPHVRSFVYYSEDKLSLSAENMSDIASAFRLLRVLDVKSIRFADVGNDMYRLIHARYIAMSLDLSILPSKFSQLWNLQTLVIDTSSPTLKVGANIWKLRHFKTNASATLPKPCKDSKDGAQLQTLGMISAESCTAELVARACNLKKLGIRGRLALLLEGKVGSFDSLRKMKYLEKLKLVNDVHPNNLASKGKLRGLPQPCQFPSRLRSLTLVATFLDWEFMSILGSLGNLEVLKLKHKAFMGNTWKVLGGGFQRLEFLHIEETDLAVWEASFHNFPRLRSLVLKNCENLLEIPILLAEVATLQLLELHACTFAVPSAKKIQEAKEKTGAEDGYAFKLSISLPTV